jgi:hypothetical protein
MNYELRDGTNAKEEFIIHTAYCKVKCAIVSRKDIYSRIFGTTKCLEDDDVFKLPIGYTEEQYQAFLNHLDFFYDDGYGWQELFGTIWMEDGTWMTRGEYDGSEWWEKHSLPIIPNVLFNHINQTP